MILAVLAGAILALGLIVVARGLYPSPPSLKHQLSTYHREIRPEMTERESFKSWWAVLAVALVRAVRGDLHDVEMDLAVTGTSVKMFATDKLNAGIGGAAIVFMVLFVGGIVSSPLAALLGSVLGFVGFFLVPDADLKSKAAARRREFNDTVTAFVELVSVSVAGGGGVNTALIDATRMGDGWAFDLLRESLADSNLRSETPWAGFERLGNHLGITSLVELSGAMALAGTSGAKVSETLVARAESARSKELSERLSEAERASETMGVPVVAMLIGWMGFLGYPAIMNLVGA